jgi:hypothetical protein
MTASGATARRSARGGDEAMWQPSKRDPDPHLGKRPRRAIRVGSPPGRWCTVARAEDFGGHVWRPAARKRAAPCTPRAAFSGVLREYELRPVRACLKRPCFGGRAATGMGRTPAASTRLSAERGQPAGE